MYSEIGILLILIIIIIAIQIFRTNKTTDNIFKNNIYLDNNGTTEICPEALASYDVCSKYGNASSDYATNAKLLLDEKYDIFNCLIIAQIFEIKVNSIDNILNIKNELEKLLKFKNIIINKLKN